MVIFLEMLKDTEGHFNNFELKYSALNKIKKIGFYFIFEKIWKTLNNFIKIYFK